MNWAKLAKEIKTTAVGTPYPRNITWFLTEQCNLNCKHCFVRNSTHKHRTEMPLEDSIKFLEQISEGIDSITLTGGEPTVSRAFPHILKYIKKIDGIKALLIFTNGMNSDLLLKGLEQEPEGRTKHVIFISLDGPENIHNSIRNNSDSYRHAINLLGKVNNANIIMTINQENHLEIDKVIDIAIKYNAKLIPNFVRTSTENCFKPDNPDNLTCDQIRSAINTWYEYAKKNLNFSDIVIHKSRLDNWLLHKCTGRWKYKCAAGIDEAVLFPDGSVAICEMKPSLGTLYDYDLNWKKFWQNHKQKGLKTCYCGYDCAITWSQTKTLAGWLDLAKTSVKSKCGL